MKVFSAKYRLIFLLPLFFISSCFRTQPNFQTRTAEDIPLTAVVDEQIPTVQSTFTPQPTATIVPTASEVVLPTTSTDVMITAINGNLFIRRGPGLVYNDIGVLYKGTSATIIGQDVLSEWVQVNIPNSKSSGWVSVQTQFSRIDGDLTAIPDFTFEEWPEPAYIKNCTEHDMWIDPVELYLESLYSNATGENEVQVNPGEYIVYDLFVTGEPEVERVSVREGITAYITINGLGIEHKCP